MARKDVEEIFENYNLILVIILGICPDKLLTDHNSVLWVVLGVCFNTEIPVTLKYINENNY